MSGRFSHMFFQSNEPIQVFTPTSSEKIKHTSEAMLRLEEFIDFDNELTDLRPEMDSHKVGDSGETIEKHITKSVKFKEEQEIKTTKTSVVLSRNNSAKLRS